MKPIAHSQGRLMFNVKDYHQYGGEGTEEQRSQAYENAQQQWWDEATQACKDAGFDGAFCEGRSNGWLQPYWQNPANENSLDGVTYPDNEMQDNDPIRDALDDVGYALGKLMSAREVMFASALGDIIAEESNHVD